MNNACMIQLRCDMSLIGMTKFNQNRNIFIVVWIPRSNIPVDPVTRTIDIVNHYHTVIKTGNVLDCYMYTYTRCK